MKRLNTGMAVILTVVLIIFMAPGLSLAQSVNTWLWEAANSDGVAGQEDAVHEFTLDLHTALGEDGCIEISFPVEFQVPEVAEGTDVGTEIEISGLAAGDDISDTAIEIDNNTAFITLGAGDSLADGNDLTITFTPDAAITNPAVPGEYEVEVLTTEDPDAVAATVEIKAAAGDYTTGSTRFNVEDTSLELDEAAEFRIRFYEGGNLQAPYYNFLNQAPLYIQTSRDIEEIEFLAWGVHNGDIVDIRTIFASDDVVSLQDPAHDIFSDVSDFDWEYWDGNDWDPTYNEAVGGILTDAEGRMFFNVTTNFSGEVTVSAGKAIDAGNVDRHLNAGQGSPITVTFAEGDISVVTLDSPAVKAAGSSFDLDATVEDAGGFPVENAEVQFFGRYKETAWTHIGTDDTDADGEAGISISREKAGEWTFRAESHGVESGEKLVTVVADAPNTISAVDETRYIEESTVNIKFSIKDRYENPYGEEALTEHHGAGLYSNVFEAVVTDPEQLQTTYDDNADLGLTGEDEFFVEVDFDQEGSWVVEGFLAGTGVSASVEVYVAEFGEVEAVRLESDDDALRSRDGVSRSDVINAIETPNGLEAHFTKLTATLLDEVGIEKEVEVDDFSFSVSDPNLARLYESTADEMYLISEEDVSGVVTVDAVHIASGKEDSVEVAIGGQPSSLDYSWASEEGELIGEMTVMYRDAGGNLTPFSADIDGAGNEGYNIFPPEGIEYFDREDFEDGDLYATFKLEAEDFGEYVVPVVTALGIRRDTEVSFFEVEDVEVEPPTEGVTMFVGSTTYWMDGVEAEMDFAPFIEGGRTFVPVRFVAERFGLEADWGPKDTRTEWVSLTAENVDIMITIGETDIQVTENGVERTVESDAAAQIRTGRTVLPLRAVGEILGAEFDYHPKDAPVVWVNFRLSN